MNKLIKTALLVVVIVISATLITGCNTIQGIGKDLQAGGQAIEDAAASELD